MYVDEITKSNGKTYSYLIVSLLLLRKVRLIILSFYLQMSLVPSTGQLWNILSKKNSIGQEADVHAVVKPLHE